MATGKPGPFHIYMAVWRGCEDACKGFQDYFRDNKIPATFTVRDAGRDKAKLAGFVQEARGLEADLVVTWGTSVTRICSARGISPIRQNTSQKFQRFS